ncbi:zinc ribbon domain-containing protein [Methanolapillus millepedarum]|uniref:Zinc-ribbon domain-containing protein n=1 Tax=Methanolapillus millepedarum TaxID=3028296 RepID=A0AA96V1K3_9EURY|nr:hypothetical protein MsAc7_02130 [Methanosarcinaceae archaeon Ac7]
MSEKYCSNCGNKVEYENAVICTNCGTALSSAKTTDLHKPVNQKTPVLSLILSFLWPGLGQVYNGQLSRGFGILIGYWIGIFIFIIPGIVVWIFGMYDAYTQAEKINKGEVPYKEAKANEIAAFIVGPLIAIFLLLFFYFFINYYYYYM